MNERLPTIRDEAIMPQTFEGMLKQAQVLVKSGLLPQSVKQAETALAIMLAGREMGIPPMQAFRSLYVVNGNVTMSAQHMAAMLIQAGVVYVVKELTDQACTIAFSRSNGMALTYTYTMDDAKTAKLTGKDNWQKFAKDMLYNRCMALGARKIAPDVLAGMYTPDELGAVEMLDEATGEVVDVQAATPTPEPQDDDLVPPDDPDDEPGWEHWPESKHKHFWAAANKLGLHKDTVHIAFGVDSMKDYGGTVDDARNVLGILDYVVNKTSIGIVGCLEALGGKYGCIAYSVHDGVTLADAKEAIADYIEAKTADGEEILVQEGIEI